MLKTDLCFACGRRFRPAGGHAADASTDGVKWKRVETCPECAGYLEEEFRVIEGDDGERYVLRREAV